MNFITVNDYPSSFIRGRDIAEYLGAKYNQQISPDEVVISVKSVFDFKSNIDYYVDVVDSAHYLWAIAERPHIKVIAISHLAEQYISARLRNKTVIIPEYHCNFDNEIRVRDEVKVVGYVGSLSNLNLDVEKLQAALYDRGLHLKVFSCQTTADATRKDIVEFYKGIDIQIAFRLPKIEESMPPELKNPLKLANAGSFNIPTVCYPELNAVAECYGSFIHAYNEEDLVRKCVELRDSKAYYEEYAGRSHEVAKFYHIKKIAEFYRRLGK